MARLNLNKRLAAAEAESQKEGKEKTLEIRNARKLNFENNPGLVGKFSMVTTGVPVFGKLSLCEKEEDDFSILFPVLKTRDKDTKKMVIKKYKDKNGNDRETNFIHPIDGECRKEIQEKTVDAFISLADNKWQELDKDSVLTEISQNDVLIRYPKMRDIESFPSLVGDCSFVTTKTMALNEIELRKNKEGNYYISYPSQSYQDANGEWKRSPYCGTYGPEATNEVLEKAVEAFKEANLLED